MAREVPPLSDSSDTPTIEPALLARIQKALLDRHYTPRTQRAYATWIGRFLAAFPGRMIDSLGEPDLRAFLEGLLQDPDLTATARNQARAALLILFHGVLGVRVDCTDGMVHTPMHGTGATALTSAEVAGMLAVIEPQFALMAGLLYGAGLRPNELLLLRVRDVEPQLELLRLRDMRESREERWAILPHKLLGDVEQHLAAHQKRHRSDLLQQAGLVSLPASIQAAEPEAARAWAWQWLFPAARINWDLRSRSGHRMHQHEAPLIRAVQAAAIRAGVRKPINAHTLRHSFKIHLSEAGCEPELVDALLGIPSPTFMSRLAAEAALGGARRLRSPLDR
jgi:integrase